MFLVIILNIQKIYVKIYSYSLLDGLILPFPYYFELTKFVPFSSFLRLGSRCAANPLTGACPQPHPYRLSLFVLIPILIRVVTPRSLRFFCPNFIPAHFPSFNLVHSQLSHPFPLSISEQTQKHTHTHTHKDTQRH